MTRGKPRKAFLYGLLSGTLVLVIGVMGIRLAQLGVLGEVVAYGLGIIVAPVAAAVAAAVMQARARRVVAIAGQALIFAFLMVIGLDYAWTFTMMVPGMDGPFQGKSDSTEQEVARVAQTWLTGRHVTTCLLGLLGGSLLGVWRANDRVRTPPAPG